MPPASYQKSSAAARRQQIMATAWQDDLATLTDAVVRISRILECLLQLVKESRAEELHQAAHEAQERTHSS